MSDMARLMTSFECGVSFDGALNVAIMFTMFSISPNGLMA